MKHLDYSVWIVSEVLADDNLSVMYLTETQALAHDMLIVQGFKKEAEDKVSNLWSEWVRKPMHGKPGRVYVKLHYIYQSRTFSYGQGFEVSRVDGSDGDLAPCR